MNTPLVQALEQLAAKRSELGTAIISLARIAGVDPAPYLGVEAGAPEAPAAAASGTPKKEPAPPRPQPPAPQKTTPANGRHKVEGSRAQAAALKDAAILSALKKHGSMKPGALAEAVHLHIQALRKRLDVLVSSGQVKAEGKTSGRTFALA